MPNLDVDIKVSADVTGAQQTTAALNEVAASATSAATAADAGAQATSTLGSSLAGMGTQGRSVISVFKGIEEAGNGTASGMFAAARGLTAFIRILSVGNPVGLFVTGLAAAVGGAVLLARALADTGESAKDLKKRMEEAHKEATLLGQADLKNITAGTQALGREIDNDTAKFKLLEAAKERVDNAEKAAALAVNRANPKISEEDRVKNEANITAEFQRRENQRRIETLSQTSDEANRRVQGQTLINTPVEKDLDREKQSLAGLRQQQTDRKRLEDQLAAEVAKTPIISKGTRGEFDDQLPANIAKINEEVHKIRPITDEEIKIQQERVEATQKAADAASQTLQIDKDKAAQAALALATEKKSQEAISKFNVIEKTADLTPKLEGARATDRTKATANTKEDATRAAEGQKLQASLATLTAAIDQLKDGILRSQQPTNSSDNQARQTSIDALSGQRDKIQSQQDAFNATPSKQDLKRTDTQAAKKDVDSLKLNTKPLEDSAKKQSDDAAAATKADNKAIQDSANTINGLPVPKPTNFDPLRNSVIEFNGKVIELQKKTQASIEDLAKTVTLQGQQIASLSQQLTAAVS